MSYARFVLRHFEKNILMLSPCLCSVYIPLPIWVAINIILRATVLYIYLTSNGVAIIEYVYLMDYIVRAYIITK